MFNMYRNSHIPKLANRTIFQQKWTSKALTRGYHGEHINEKKWKLLFSRRLQSVTSFNPRYMAKFDGSEQAAGRGRGLKLDPEKAKTMSLRERFNPENGTNQATDMRTPYMQMTYAPMERRLDTAIFRAMFASSTRQARQFVIHGNVTVNGQKMKYPSYMLNPGDMFQVNMDRVLYATGMPKRRDPNAKTPEQIAERKEKEHGQMAQYEEDALRVKRTLELRQIFKDAKLNKATEEEAHEAVKKAVQAKADAGPEQQVEAEAMTQLLDSYQKPMQFSPFTKANFTARSWASPTSDWYTLYGSKVLSIAARNALNAIEKKNGQRVHAHLARLLSRANDLAVNKAHSLPQTASLSQRMADMMNKLKLTYDHGFSKTKSKDPERVKFMLSDAEVNKLTQLAQNQDKNAYDPSKPYATPWRPRPYMKAFAVIPRYLEVNHNICAAVYVRHPVARPGMAEIPTPFPPEISQMAFNWYLRR